MGKKLTSNKNVFSNLHCSNEVKNMVESSCGKLFSKKVLLSYIIEDWFNAEKNEINSKIISYFNEKKNDVHIKEYASLPCYNHHHGLIKKFCGRAITMSWLVDQIILDFFEKNSDENFMKKLLAYDKRTN